MEGNTKGFNNEIINVNDFLQKLTEESKKNVVRIQFGNEMISEFGTGFLCKIYINNNPMPVLITCYHVLNEDYFKKYQFLYFSYGSDKDQTEILIDLNIPRIKYLNKGLDVTIIEIKEEDNLDIFSFLEMDNSIDVSNPQIINNKVYLLHYPKGVNDLQFSKGNVKKLTDNNINFLAIYSTEPGSSGCPIIDYNKNKVIGVHNKRNTRSNERRGILLKFAVELFISEKNEEIKKTYKNLYSFINTMEMIYIIPPNKNIKFFHNHFVIKYEKVCTIIYNGSIFPLTEMFNHYYLTDADKNKGEITITLKGIEYVRDMSSMFRLSFELKKVNATRTDFSKVESMERMFEHCINLEELSDTSYWNVENVKSMKGLFYNCVKLKSIPGIRKWKPKKLETYEEMFLACCDLLKPTEISQVEEWKNITKIPEDKKQEYRKGYTNKNLISYALFDNFSGTLKYVKNFFSN